MYLAPGEVSSASTDAVNGSQLYATDQRVTALEYFHVNSFKPNEEAAGGDAIAIGPPGGRIGQRWHGAGPGSGGKWPKLDRAGQQRRQRRGLGAGHRQPCGSHRHRRRGRRRERPGQRWGHRRAGRGDECQRNRCRRHGARSSGQRHGVGQRCHRPGQRRESRGHGIGGHAAEAAPHRARDEGRARFGCRHGGPAQGRRVEPERGWRGVQRVRGL
ncbi:hypothetical protein CYJ10_01280 [Cupriavidus pauculus]|uniref:Trimeric autotransporter adhesin YadA-like stalk domain-containing protein n=1 Tax=Cupriavidus pauculus TaxID=82633 RepID=A0A2N5CIB6_9BURK|nr:hypothetical protein CYJ10_01280 [Cupriavidus pauculus]